MISKELMKEIWNVLEKGAKEFFNEKVLPRALNL